jgi:hypothetical protein
VLTGLLLGWLALAWLALAGLALAPVLVADRAVADGATGTRPPPPQAAVTVHTAATARPASSARQRGPPVIT